MDNQFVDRTITIFETLADRSQPKGARQHLAQHLDQLYGNGEHDMHRLTMKGVAFLHNYSSRRDH